MTDHRNARSALRLAGLVFMALWLGSRVSVALHEWLGHALVAQALGADVEQVVVRVFGGGFVRARHLPDSTGAILAFDLGGMAVNAVAALASLAILRRIPASLGRPWALGLAIFATINTISATHYFTLGGYYEFGDSARVGPWWPAGLVVLLATTPLMLRLVWRHVCAWPGAPRATAARAGALLVATGLYAAGLAAEVQWTQGEAAFVALRAESAHEQKQRREAEADHRPPPPAPFPLTATVVGFDLLAFAWITARTPAEPPDRPA